jgi:ketosteroid isomerase-like protein
MYSLIIRRKITQAFKQLNAGDYDSIVKQFAPNAEHIMYGNHALAGSRYTPAAIQKWYARLATVFPDLKFKVKTLTVNGWPWDTSVGVEWDDFIKAKDGVRFTNHGVHIFRIRWGKVVSLHIFCDTQKIEEVLNHQASSGISEAAAKPIDEAKP